MSHAFGVVRPDDATTLLLRACLLDGDDARNAFRDWLDRVGDPFTALRSGRWRAKTVLPLLHANLRKVQCEPHDPAFRAHLRAATERERLRTAPHREVVRSVLDAMAADGQTLRLLASGVLAEKAYPEPEHRHCYGVELVVHEHEVADVARTLHTVATQSPDDASLFVHVTTVPIRLRTRITPACFPTPGPDATFVSVPDHIFGLPCLTLPPELMLVQICTEAFCSRVASGDVTWITDAWFGHAAAPELDWDMFTTIVDDRRLHIPVVTILSYLAHDIGLPVPERAIVELDRSAGRASRTERDLAMAFAWSAARRPIGPGQRMRLTPRDAMAFARSRLAPAPGFIRATHDVDAPLDLVLAYARRPLRFARRHVPVLRRQRMPK